MLSGDVMFS